MAKSPKPFLLHILDAIESITEFITGYNYEQFLDDPKTQYAVVHLLEIIGEATTNLDEKFKNDHQSIPWREIADFRNVLIHEYWSIDEKLVWKAATEEVVELKQNIEQILHETC